jgi:hypothetical protein
VRRLFNQRLTLRGSRIASAHFGAHIDLACRAVAPRRRAPVFLAQQRANSSKRLLQILADIVAQRFERGDIDHPRFIWQLSLRAFAEQHVH